jgi:hypothetical protein
MKPLRAVVLAAILAVAVGAPYLRGAAIENEAVALASDPNVPSLSLSAQLPMYPAFGPPSAALPET